MCSGGKKAQMIPFFVCVFVHRRVYGRHWLPRRTTGTCVRRESSTQQRNGQRTVCRPTSRQADHVRRIYIFASRDRKAALWPRWNGRIWDAGGAQYVPFRRETYSTSILVHAFDKRRSAVVQGRALSSPSRGQSKTRLWSDIVIGAQDAHCCIFVFLRPRNVPLISRIAALCFPRLTDVPAASVTRDSCPRCPLRTQTHPA